MAGCIGRMQQRLDDVPGLQPTPEATSLLRRFAALSKAKARAGLL